MCVLGRGKGWGNDYVGDVSRAFLLIPTKSYACKHAVVRTASQQNEHKSEVGDLCILSEGSPFARDKVIAVSLFCTRLMM